MDVIALGFAAAAIVALLPTLLLLVQAGYAEPSVDVQGATTTSPLQTATAAAAAGRRLHASFAIGQVAAFVAPQEWLVGLSWSVCRVRLE